MPPTASEYRARLEWGNLPHARTIANGLSKEKLVFGRFFFRKGARDVGTSKKFVTILVSQLGKDDELVLLLVGAWTKYVGADDKALEYQWRDLVKEPLTNSEHNPTTLIFDAIDEQTPRSTQADIFEYLPDGANFERLNIR